MAKLVKCKTCGNNIAKSAKVCPHCGAKNKHGGGCGVVIVLIVVIVAIGVAMGRGKSNTSTASNAAASRDEKAKQIIEQRLDYLKNIPEISGFVVLEKNNVYITLKKPQLFNDYNVVCNAAAFNASKELVTQKVIYNICTVYLLPPDGNPGDSGKVIYKAYASDGVVKSSGDEPYGEKLKLQAMTPEQRKAYQVEKRRQALASQFANKFERKFDGSIKPVVEYVKRNMKNPGSFKHVSTRWYIRRGIDRQYIVRMQYQGTNSFGAVVTENVELVVDQEGRIIRE